MTTEYLPVERIDAGLAPGDVVALRSGGPKMTVVSVTSGQVECFWFVIGQSVKQTFPAATLRRLDLVGSIFRWITMDT